MKRLLTIILIILEIVFTLLLIQFLFPDFPEVEYVIGTIEVEHVIGTIVVGLLSGCLIAITWIVLED